MADISVDVQELDDYGKEHKAELLGIATMPKEVTDHMTLVPGIKDKFEVSTLTFAKLVKPYDKDWNPEKKGAIKPRVLRVELGQVELEEEPLRYRKTYLGKLMKSGVDPKDHPFEGAFLREIAKKIKEDVALDLVWRGEKGSSTTPGAVNDGFFKLIDDAKTANELTVANGHVIETGALTSANIIDKLEIMWESLPEAYKRVPTKMFLSVSNKIKHDKAYKAENGALPYNTEFKKTFLEVSDGMCELVPQAGFGTTDRVVISTEENMLYGVDLESDEEMVHVFSPGNPKVTGFLVVFAIGFQFATEKAIWVNDQTESSSSSSASA